MAWATAHGRALQPGDIEVFLEPLLEREVSERLCFVLAAAAERYVDLPTSKVLLSDLAHLTQCHYWLLSGVSPPVLGEVSAFYEKHALRLKIGEEESARSEYDKAMARSNGESRWKVDYDRAVRENKHLETKCKRLEHEKKILEGKLKATKAKLEGDEEIKAKNVEIKKLERELHETAKKTYSMDILRKENERLVRLLQEKEES
jgi:hypothetical protein